VSSEAVCEAESGRVCRDFSSAFLEQRRFRCKSGGMIRIIVMLLAFTWLMPSVSMAAARKILVLGDSQSEEYDYEVTFSAPASNPVEANIKNWIEILSARRSAQVSFGSYASTVGS
jgi:hypothetical protein